MSYALRALACVLSCLFMLQCTIASAADLTGLQSLAATDYHLLESASADRNYHVYVGLPAEYSANADRHYPTVYVLDGGELYPLLVSYAHYLRSGEEIPGVIVVGISYGTRDWQNGNDRSHDFTAPSSEREFWGGAADFQAFLGKELIPFVESNYRARTDRRILFGQSLGGQFVLHAAQTEPGLFWGHIASNPALHRNLAFYTEQRPAALSRSSRPKLFVSSGSIDDDRFRKPALEWMSYWNSVGRPPWDLRTVTLDGYGHFSAAPVAFRSGMLWLFANEQTAER